MGELVSGLGCRVSGAGCRVLSFGLGKIRLCSGIVVMPLVFILLINRLLLVWHGAGTIEPETRNPEPDTRNRSE